MMVVVLAFLQFQLNTFDKLQLVQEKDDHKILEQKFPFFQLL
jgi:hypothetical protein